ncbi:hypothetical protein QZH41_019995, partial [Actinostola sp. cb2023]
LSAGIICASVALADAGIEMQDLVAACTLLVPSLAYHCNLFQLSSGQVNGSMMAALLPSVNQVSGLIQTGEMTKDSTEKAVNTCMDGCARIYPVMQDALVKNVKRTLLSKGTSTCK